MLKLVRTFITSLTIATMAALPAGLALQPAYAAAFDASKNAACEGIDLAGADCNGAAGNKVSSVLNTIVTLLSVIVGAAAVIMIIVSGFKFVTAAGDSNKVASARNTLLYAVVGLIIVGLTQFIINFVLKQV